MISNVIDGALAARGGLPSPDDQDSLAALRNLLDNFSTNGGRGASGIDFFAVSGIDQAADRRDLMILSSLRAALDLLGSAEFFGSANQNDYRWGRLHRIIFEHPLGGPFNIRAGGGALATDGGFETVDAATHSARAMRPDEFMFRDGPVHRTVVALREYEVRAESIWPGGTSGVLGSPNYSQFLKRWLTNETVKLSLGTDEAQQYGAAVERFFPALPI